MTWACCVCERVSVHVVSSVAVAWESQCAWIWLLLTGEIWKSFNWPDCKGVKISQPVMCWHMCLWNQSHVGTHICEINCILAHTCETKHALVHMSVKSITCRHICLWNRPCIGTHVCKISHTLAHKPVEWNPPGHHFSDRCRVYMCSSYVFMKRCPPSCRFGAPLPLGKWCGACFFSLLWIWTISLSSALMCLLWCPLSC